MDFCSDPLKKMNFSWVINNYQDLFKKLPDANKLANERGVVYFIIKDLSEMQANYLEITYSKKFPKLKFSRYKYIFDLLWKIFNEKYNLVITNGGCVEVILELFNVEILDENDIIYYEEIR